MKKIVQVRGGSGSGKSTIVRAWTEENAPAERYMMSNAATWGLDHIDCAQSRPFALGFPAKGVIVPGHYDAPGGGCDMIKSVYHIYDVVRRASFLGKSVLMEGLFVSKDTKATQKLLDWAKGHDVQVHIILIDIEEDVAYQSVQDRRAALGKEERVLRAHHGDFRSVHVTNRPHYDRWHKADLACVHEASREGAAQLVRELLL